MSRDQPVSCVRRRQVMAATYEEIRGSFQLDVPEQFNFARDVVGRWAEDRNRRAMVWLGRDGEERQITFRDFYRRARRAAAAFRAAGIKKGDRKSTRLNSSHLVISYAVFCLKKKKHEVVHSESRCES